MLVDLSHVSHKTMADVASLTTAPLFFSHSSSAALCNTSRNVPDSILLEMKRLDGVVMINFWPELITCSSTATIDDVVDHIMYISKLIGANHVGFGADFDGIPNMTSGLEDVGTYINLVARLYERGMEDKEVEGIIGGNFLRVLEKTQDLANENGPDETHLAYNLTC